MSAAIAPQVKRKNLLGAMPGKKVVLFIDDLNMPTVEQFGAQPPIELLRQMLGMGGFYDRKLLFWKDTRAAPEAHPRKSALWT